MSDILMTRGDNKDIDITVVLEGEPQDLTGATLTFTAKFLPTDADPYIQKDNLTLEGGITVTDAAGGEATISLLPADTSGLTVGNPTSRGVYYTPSLVWDLQLTTADDRVYTLDSGRIIVRADITTPVV